MNFTCPHCGRGSFTIVRDGADTQLAKWNNCGKSMPFSKEQMKSPAMGPNKSRRLHLK